MRAEEQAAGGASQHATVEGADADPVGIFQKVFLKIPMLEQESAGLRAELLSTPTAIHSLIERRWLEGKMHNFQ